MPSQNAAKNKRQALVGDPARGSATGESTEAGRARRMAALKKVAGIWAKRKDIPADGLEYERELRG